MDELLKQHQVVQVLVTEMLFALVRRLSLSVFGSEFHSAFCHVDDDGAGEFIPRIQIREVARIESDIYLDIRGIKRGTRMQYSR